MIVSHLSHSNTYGFQKALDFLKTAHNLPVGKYPIEGDDIFAIVQENKPKTLKEAKFEAHKQYIDVQCILSGTERIDFAPLEDLTVSEPYDPQRDVVFLRGEARSTLILKEKEYAVFFPEDAHRPGIGVNPNEGLIRKVVVKIRC